MGHEVPTPIICSPYVEPTAHWHIEPGADPVKRDGRRLSFVFRGSEDEPWEIDPNDPTLRRLPGYANAFELPLVNLVRDRVAAWRAAGYPGVTKTTLELLTHWNNPDRDRRLFFAQREAAETVIFLVEARPDFLQGIDVPWDPPSEDRQAAGYGAWRRYASKLATGAGKTTVMAMLSAWSVLNKVVARSDARFSDVVLVVCPSVTIRHRLQELDPGLGEASLYAVRDIVPRHLLDDMAKGRVVITNWHVFEPQQMNREGGESARVVQRGVRQVSRVQYLIGEKTTTGHGYRYITFDDLQREVLLGRMTVLREHRDEQGALQKVDVESVRYVESDAAIVARVLGREIGGKQNILVFNDEAHHAYRIRTTAGANGEADEDDDEEIEYTTREATVWVEGLDRVHKLRGINLCIDLSATPYFLSRVGEATTRPFPWIVSDFSLLDAIESGLVKVPQLAVKDASGKEDPAYRNIWRWVMDKLSPRERGGGRTSPNPAAILRYAQPSIRMMAERWEETRRQWAEKGEARPPVFILVCKTTKLAKVVHEWIAEGKCPTGLSPLGMDTLRNSEHGTVSIRVDTSVVHETDADRDSGGAAKQDEARWMRFTLDTVGKGAWPSDRQGRPVYPEGFEALAQKLGRPLHPPGRDVRCIVSVGMLTEGWDCTTVTHILGLRPFMSQLLCEQVAGRGLRRASYEPGANDMFAEEVAQIFGVPFEMVPFKESGEKPSVPAVERIWVAADPAREQYRIEFPRVEGYTQSVRNRVTLDLSVAPALVVDPASVPTEVELNAALPDNRGRLAPLNMASGETLTLGEHRSQELEYALATAVTQKLLASPSTAVPAHALFPQVLRIVREYLAAKVTARHPATVAHAFSAPWFFWIAEQLSQHIRPAEVAGRDDAEVAFYERQRAPGSTADIGFYTRKKTVKVARSHVPVAVCDTHQMEQIAAGIIDKHWAVEAFVKNEGLGLTIPYLLDNVDREYIPDFLVRLAVPRVVVPRDRVHVLLETKGDADKKWDVKRAAAERWCRAVSREGSWGKWEYLLVRDWATIPEWLDVIAKRHELVPSPRAA